MSYHGRANEREVAMERCSRCGAKIRGQVHWSPTGAKQCGSCQDLTVAAVVGIERGSVADAVALGARTPSGTSGVLAWIRRTLRRGNPSSDL